MVLAWEVFRVGEHFEIDRSGRVYRPHQYVALAGEHAFTEAKTAEKLTLPVCEQGPKHRFFAHCQFFAKSLEKLAEAVQAVDEGHGAVAVQVRELQYEQECLSSEERQDPRELFIGLLKGLRGRARMAVRPPPPQPPPRKAPDELANQPPPPYLGRPAPGLASHSGADGLQGAAVGAGGGRSAAGGSAKPRNGHPVKAADHGSHAEGDAAPRKGKTFRGGSKHTRDNWYGYDRDNGFVRWWHREGKHEFGRNDMDSAAEVKAMYEHWLQLGKPVPK
ncbi:MAG TPA: hypothetical protein PLW65_13000 [Pseudomonadota bacterium]|nr:hypothetical protein [Pseudomonadota bacterium]